jgi:hypothetical protein
MPISVAHPMAATRTKQCTHPTPKLKVSSNPIRGPLPMSQLAACSQPPEPQIKSGKPIVMPTVIPCPAVTLLHATSKLAYHCPSAKHIDYKFLPGPVGPTCSTCKSVSARSPVSYMQSTRSYSRRGETCTSLIKDSLHSCQLASCS